MELFYYTLKLENIGTYGIQNHTKKSVA